jgi:hypothetical protein
VRPGRAADHSPPSSAAVMEEQSYTSTHPLGHTGPLTGSLYLCLYVLTFFTTDGSFCIIFFFLLAIRKNTVYKLIWWLYKVRYDSMSYNDVVGYAPSDVTSGAL